MAWFFAAAFSAVFIVSGYYWFPTSLIHFDETRRINFAIRCDIFAVLTLLLGVMKVATQRFFSEAAIDGAVDSIEEKIQINIRYIVNTLEQCFLLMVTHFALATFLAPQQIRLIPILVILFIIGRLLFWHGYHRNPYSRAFGFATSFYPTAFFMIYACFKIMFS